MWAHLCLTAPVVCFSQTPDTTGTVVLNEVVVKSRPVVSRVDGTGYLPSAEQKKMATSGLDLLQRMQLPRIVVNPLAGGIRLSGGGEPELRINGAAATVAEVMALRPEDIVRIDYHDAPDARYSEAEAVIDYIVRIRESGGSVAVEGMNGVGRGKWAAMDNVSGQYGFGSSSLSLTASLFGMHRNNWVRDYEEEWKYPEGEVRRCEEGLPVSVGEVGTQSVLGYAYRGESGLSVSVRASLEYRSVPGMEEGDRHSILHTSTSEETVEVSEHTTEREMSPSVGLFLRYGNLYTGRFTANVAGVYKRTSSSHVYQECSGEEPGDSIVSDVAGRVWSASAEGYYERTAGAVHLLGGGRYSRTHTSNAYLGTVASRVSMTQHAGSVFAEGDVRLGRLSVMGNVTVALLATRQDGWHSRNIALMPSASVGYESTSEVRLRYDVKVTRKQPSAATAGNAEVMIQPGYVKRGNPSVKPFSVVDNRFIFGYTRRLFSLDVALSYRHEFKPVMSETTYDGGRFVLSYANQRSFGELRSETSLTLRPWGDRLSVSVAPSVSRYYSRGNSYSHTGTIFHLGLNVNFSIGRWTAMCSIMTGASNHMYGEEIVSEKDMNMLLVGYKHDWWTIQVGAFNLFMKEYWMKSRNMSKLTPYQSRAHCGDNAYVAVKFGVNINFGRSRDLDVPEVAPDAVETGIMQSTK